MPYDPTPPNWRSRQHPLNQLMHDLGASGGIPTEAELAAIPPRARFEVLAAARRIDQNRQAGNYLDARREAERALGTLGEKYGALPLPETEPAPQPTNLHDLGRRMFGPN